MSSHPSLSESLKEHSLSCALLCFGVVELWSKSLDEFLARRLAVTFSKASKGIHPIIKTIKNRLFARLFGSPTQQKETGSTMTGGHVASTTQWVTGGWLWLPWRRSGGGSDGLLKVVNGKGPDGWWPSFWSKNNYQMYSVDLEKGRDHKHWSRSIIIRSNYLTIDLVSAERRSRSIRLAWGDSRFLLVQRFGWK